MDNINYLEWIGYIGSVIVALSLTMTSMVKLRWTNLVGALFFTIYAIAIKAIPVALVNGFIVIIDVYYLFKMYTTKDFFTIQKVKADNEYLQQFIAFYKESIPKDFPHFFSSDSKNQMAFLVLRNMQVASVFIGSRQDDSSLEIDLDFAIPQYRDFKTGDFLFNKNAALFKEEGISKLRVKPHSKSQLKYYPKVGFVQDENTENVIKLF